MDSGITLTNNETKDIKSLWNRVTLLKELLPLCKKLPQIKQSIYFLKMK